MLLVGSILVAGAVLLTAATALFFRQPDPPRWTRPDLVAMLVAVPITALMALGFGYMGVGAYRLTGPEALYQVPSALGVWVLAVLVWHRLGVRARLRAYAASDVRALRPGPAATSGSSAAAPASPANDPAHLRAA